MSSFPGKPPRFGLDKDPPLQLEFIDHGDDNARKRVRSHAMKDVQRRKRWDYARSTDHKRRHEERKRSVQASGIVAVKVDAEQRQDVNNRAQPENATQEPYQNDLSKSNSYDIAQRVNPTQPQVKIPLPQYHQNHDQPRPCDQHIPHGLPGKIHSEPGPTSIPLRYHQPQLTPRSPRRTTQEDNSEPSLVDDESTTESESRRGQYNSQSPESDKWDDSQTRVAETQRYPLIADSDNDNGMTTDSDFDEINPKSRQSSYHSKSFHPAVMPVPSPKSLFSAARYDPFDSLAKSVKPEDRALVDHRKFFPLTAY
jgi:hypothetical protein